MVDWVDWGGKEVVLAGIGPHVTRRIAGGDLFLLLRRSWTVVVRFSAQPSPVRSHGRPQTPHQPSPARPPTARPPPTAHRPPPPLPTTARHCPPLPAHRNAEIRPQASPRRRVSTHPPHSRRALTPNPNPNPDRLDSNGPLILSSPFISSLLFQNDASDARDHCANERSLWSRSSTLPCSYQLHPCLRN